MQLPILFIHLFIKYVRLLKKIVYILLIVQAEVWSHRKGNSLFIIIITHSNTYNCYNFLLWEST